MLRNARGGGEFSDFLRFTLKFMIFRTNLGKGGEGKRVKPFETILLKNLKIDIFSYLKFPLSHDKLIST